MSNTRDDLVASLHTVGLIGSVRAGQFDRLFDGTSPTDQRKKEFGIYYYDNAIVEQIIPSGVWTTLTLDSSGPATVTEFGPEGLGDIMDSPSGRIDLSGLSIGDEVYIRHILNITPNLASSSYMFSHLVGAEPNGFRLPTITAPLGGAGQSTGKFVLDTHFFLQSEHQKQTGAFPQIFSSGGLIVNHLSTYISISRREV